MKALCWLGSKNVKVQEVPDPRIEEPRDIIVRVTLTAICGSDLHLYHGHIPEMKRGDILGHEFMGEVVEVGREVERIKVGDRVVVPFAIACGGCFFCERSLYALCDNSNRTPETCAKYNGYSSAGLFGYSHIYGGYAGGQAEYVRVPYADVGAFVVSNELPDEQLLFLSDILPTGWMAAEACNIQSNDTVAVWGCGPVGQFAIRSAFLLGASRVIAIDRYVDRLAMAAEAGAETLNYNEVTDVYEAVKELTRGQGPDACIDAVGMEAHGTGFLSRYEEVKQNMGLAKDVPVALREAIMTCRKGGTVSLPGVYAATVNHLPIGPAFAKGLTFKMGQTHVHRYMPRLYPLITQGKIDPSLIITHRFSLNDAEHGYKVFSERAEGCLKVVLKPE